MTGKPRRTRIFCSSRNTLNARRPGRTRYTLRSVQTLWTHVSLWSVVSYITLRTLVTYRPLSSLGAYCTD
jgi:hypothetical protein